MFLVVSYVVSVLLRVLWMLTKILAIFKCQSLFVFKVMVLNWQKVSSMSLALRYTRR